LTFSDFLLLLCKIRGIILAGGGNVLNSKEIGNRIKMAREKADMSLNDVASKLGVNKSTILRYENGEISKVKAPIIEALADALRVSPHYLLGWEGDEEVEKKNDFIAEAVIKMRTDETFASVVENLYKLDQDKLETINQMLNTLFK
jgi:transcriptional regulator with XRE-family HTH domain